MRSGFTLLETLIALVIASLVTLVVMDSLSAATGHAARLEQVNRIHTERVLALIPVMRALEGAVPDYHDGDALFTGEARRVRGLTHSSVRAGINSGDLIGAPGAPTSFEIRVEGGVAGTRLLYAENGEVAIEATLPDGARLAYRDAAGAQHDVWPPPDGFESDPLYYRPIPAALLILDGDRPVLAATLARTASLNWRVQDLELVL